MGRPKKFGDRKQITFSVDEAEYKWVELQASGNVSAWCREQVLSDMVSKPEPKFEHVQGPSITFSIPSRPERPAGHKRCASATCPYCN